MMYEELYQFIKAVDTAFPIPLSDKVNLSDFTEKLLKKATMYAEYKDGKIVSLIAGSFLILNSRVFLINILLKED